ncbi:hypothetical protein GU243_21000 [Pseudarthrobacter psychrotolerans]|uniref:Uncharacterized protein n=1 Tax=Pseudarthrobacter psychrotolerans TaxID=2697569 RepID=A0A6P1NPW4_9MICC|nr:hypothetical protein [Pseudarthrobacter psychrotolerans]QHK21749.1 hypothetical protein GU243_21000 [Pseudarthrobacter psychrotolerans]
MPPTPPPTPLDVYVHSGPAEWWQIVAALGPAAVLLGALVAAVIGWRTLRQKAEADNRAEWWKRTQWALDAVYSGDKKRAIVGLKVLGVLAESDLAGSGELAVLEASWKKPLSEAKEGLRGEKIAVARSSGKIVVNGNRAGKWTVAGRQVDADAAGGDNVIDDSTEESEGGRL